MSKTSFACFLLSSTLSTLLLMSILAFFTLCWFVFAELTLRFLVGAMITERCYVHDTFEKYEKIHFKHIERHTSDKHLNSLLEKIV